MLLDDYETAFWLRKLVGEGYASRAWLRTSAARASAFLVWFCRGHVRECGAGTNARARAQHLSQIGPHYNAAVCVACV